MSKGKWIPTTASDFGNDNTTTVEQPSNNQQVAPQKRGWVPTTADDMQQMGVGEKKKDGSYGGNGYSLGELQSPEDISTAYNNFQNKKATAQDIGVLANTDYGKQSGIDSISPDQRQSFADAVNNSGAYSKSYQGRNQAIKQYWPDISKTLQTEGVNLQDFSKKVMAGNFDALKTARDKIVSKLQKDAFEIENNDTGAYAETDLGQGAQQTAQLQKASQLREQAANITKTFNTAFSFELANKYKKLANGKVSDIDYTAVGKEYNSLVNDQEQTAKDKLVENTGRMDYDAIVADQNLKYKNYKQGLEVVLNDTKANYDNSLVDGVLGKNADKFKQADIHAGQMAEVRNAYANIYDKFPSVALNYTGKVIGDEIAKEKGYFNVFTTPDDVKNAVSRLQKDNPEFINKFGNYINVFQDEPNKLPKRGAYGAFGKGVYDVAREIEGLGRGKESRAIKESADELQPALQATSFSGADPTKIVLDNKGAAFAENKNEHYGKYDANNLTRIIGGSLPGLIEFAALEEITGGLATAGLARGAKAVNAVGKAVTESTNALIGAKDLQQGYEAIKFTESGLKSFKSTSGLVGAQYLTSFNNNMDFAEENIKDNSPMGAVKKSAVANLVTLFEAGTFKLAGISPSSLIGTSIRNSAVKEALEFVEKTGNSYGEKELYGFYQDRLLPMIKSAATSGTKLGTISVANQAIKDIVGNVYNPKYQNAADYGKIFTESAILGTVVDGLPKIAERLPKANSDALYNAGLYRDEMVQHINESVKNGGLTQEQANPMIQAVNTMQEQLAKNKGMLNKKGLPLTTEQQKDIAVLNFRKQYLIDANKKLSEQGEKTRTAGEGEAKEKEVESNIDRNITAIADINKDIEKVQGQNAWHQVDGSKYVKDLSIQDERLGTVTELKNINPRKDYTFFDEKTNERKEINGSKLIDYIHQNFTPDESEIPQSAETQAEKAKNTQPEGIQAQGEITPAEISRLSELEDKIKPHHNIEGEVIKEPDILTDAEVKEYNALKEKEQLLKTKNTENEKGSQKDGEKSSSQESSQKGSQENDGKKGDVAPAEEAGAGQTAPSFIGLDNATAANKLVDDGYWTKQEYDNWFEKSSGTDEQKAEAEKLLSDKKDEAKNKATKLPDTETARGTANQYADKKSKGTKFSQRAREIAAKIENEGLTAALPDWAKISDAEGVQRQGFGGKELDKAIARSIRIVADVVDATGDFAKGVKDGFENLKKYYAENTKSFDEDKLRAGFEARMNDLFKEDEPEETPAEKLERQTKERAERVAEIRAKEEDGKELTAAEERILRKQAEEEAALKKEKGEVAEPEPILTSVKNAVVNTERQQRGLKPVLKEAARKFGKVWEDAKNMVRTGTDPRRYVESLHTRELGVRDAKGDFVIPPEKKFKIAEQGFRDVDNALVLMDRIDLINQQIEATDRLEKASRGGNGMAEMGAYQDLQRINVHLEQNDYVADKIGTSAGRTLASRRMLATLEYNLSKMTNAIAADYGGKDKIPKEVMERLKTLEKDHADAMKKLSDYEEKFKQQKAEDAYKKEVAKNKEPKPEKDKPKQKGTQSEAAKLIIKKSKDLADKIRNSETLDAFGFGAAPEGVKTQGFSASTPLKESIAKAVEAIGQGLANGLDKAELIAQHIKEIIDKHSNKEITEEQLRNGFEKTFEDEKQEPKETVAEKNLNKIKSDAGLRDIPTITKDMITPLRRIINEYARNGETDFNKVLNKVYDDLKDSFTDLSKEDIRDAYSGYGEVRLDTKNGIIKILNDWKREQILMAQLADVKDGLIPQRSKKDGRIIKGVSDEKFKELKKQLEENMKAAGITWDNPPDTVEEKKQRALDNFKERITNQIEQLEQAISSKTPIEKKGGKTELDEQGKQLEAQRDALKKIYDDVVLGKEGKQQAERVRKLQDELQRVKDRQEKTTDPKDRRELSDQEKELTKQISDEKKKWDIEKEKSLTPEQLVERASKKLDKEIEKLQKDIDDIASGEYTENPQRKPRSTSELLDKRKQRDDLKELKRKLYVDANNIDEKAIALEKYKDHLHNKIVDNAWKIANGDFEEPKEKEPIRLDAEAKRLELELKRSETALRQEKVKSELANRSKYQKILDNIAAYKRFSVLTGIPTIGKLAAAVAYRTVTSPVEELFGAGLGILPGISTVARQAPREGGMNLQAGRQSLKQFGKGTSALERWAATDSYTDARKIVKEGQSELDHYFGKFSTQPPETMEVMGRLHGAMKNFAKRAEFARSYQKRMDFAIDKGADPHDELTQLTAMSAAYIDANRAIFMQDNKLVTKYNNMLRDWESNRGDNRFANIAMQTLATLVRFVLPIVKIPTNFIYESSNFAFGLPRAAIETGARAALEATGIKKFEGMLSDMTEDEADSIMRSFKKGGIGAGMFSLGYFNPTSAGGFYIRGQKANGDMDYDQVRILDWHVPKWATHFPLFMVWNLGATARRIADKKEQGIAKGTFGAAKAMFNEMPFLNQYQELVDLDIQKFGEDELISLIPLGIQNIAGYLDWQGGWGGGARKTKPTNFKEKIENAIPGLHDKVPGKKGASNSSTSVGAQGVF